MNIKLLFTFFIAFTLSSASVFGQSQQAYYKSQDNSQKTEKEAVVYPNPARDNISIKLNNPNLKLKSVTIYAIIGVQVAEYNNLNQNTIDLRIDKLKPGRYLVKYTLSNNVQQITSLIKE
ncbi:T9SS type A sorting domain-containing protein [Elizabethkingia sp. JS20170427COW]|uniref:T9SS type A sorting domain-containing protein n=1 Tax=Elizabethkingia sp. JS20170427COW TaxID=2583851 RepID=UPI00143CDA35|nr:T9SS type A sorting domain-containing protein [Elizabethkingia sp. JS20170427COW]